VLLVGAGALKFARRMGFLEQELLTAESKARWEKERDDFWVGGRQAATAASVTGNHDTVCVLGVDARGNLASAVSTSGLSWKLAGRVGDSPILGAGSYVDNDVGAAAATGVGELTLRTLASFAIVERMRAGSDPERACREVMERILAKVPETRTDKRLELAFIALDKRGRHGAVALRGGPQAFPYALASGEAPAAMQHSPVILSEAPAK
jgi:N4-(beta-N-acetylglucosaminyl)-L-asparaginase